MNTLECASSLALYLRKLASDPRTKTAPVGRAHSEGQTYSVGRACLVGRASPRAGLSKSPTESIGDKPPILSTCLFTYCVFYGRRCVSISPTSRSKAHSPDCTRQGQKNFCGSRETRKGDFERWNMISLRLALAADRERTEYVDSFPAKALASHHNTANLAAGRITRPTAMRISSAVPS